MSKFLMRSKTAGVNAAATKLFPRVPTDEECAHLLENRADLSLFTLLDWHATGDERAPRDEVIAHLRSEGADAWIAVARYPLDVPADRLRDWLVQAGSAAPYGVWLEAAGRLASPIGRRIAAAIEARTVEDLPPPPFDPAFMRLLVERHKDAELVAVLVEWLRAQDDELRCSYLCLLERAGVLGAIPNAASLLQKNVVPEWPPKLPSDALAAAPVANVAHWLALRLPESQRADADAWIVEQYLSAIRCGGSWLDIFWRIPPRLRPIIAIASLDLEPTRWSPFAGTALAERITAGETTLWPRAMEWLERFSFVRSVGKPDGWEDWMQRHLGTRELLGFLGGKKSAAWESLTPRAQCNVGPLFAATAVDGNDGTHVFHPALAGIHALEGAPLPPGENVDRAWAALYARPDFALGFGLELLKKRFTGPLVRHRAELLLDGAMRTDLRLLGPVLNDVIAVTGHVPLEKAPIGDQLLAMDIDAIRTWREVAGPPFDGRIDARIAHEVTTEPSPTTLHRARLLGRPLRDEWKRAWRAALRTWRFADILSYRRDEPWLVADDEIAGLLLARLAVEGDDIFRIRDLPDVVRPIVVEHVLTVDDDRLAADLLAWLARSNPKGTDALALERLRTRPGEHCAGWWGDRLSSTQQWNEHGVDVLDALLRANLFDLVWQVIERSRRARASRVAEEATAANARGNGRPKKLPDEGKFIAAIHLALAKAICRALVRDASELKPEDIERMAKAICALEPPPLITHDLESVARALRHIGARSSVLEALNDLKQITRAGAPEADYGDLLLALQILARKKETSR